MRFYRFELHTHTLCSDGAMTPAELAENAKLRRYDGIVLTDHNNVFGIPAAKKRGEELGR
jgi:Predicted metal-dependent phosphoesterases (PHP family)